MPACASPGLIKRDSISKENENGRRHAITERIRRVICWRSGSRGVHSGMVVIVEKLGSGFRRAAETQFNVVYEARP